MTDIAPDAAVSADPVSDAPAAPTDASASEPDTSRWPQEAIDKLAETRAEAKSHRERAEKYDKAFSGYAPEEREFILEAAGMGRAQLIDFAIANVGVLGEDMMAQIFEKHGLSKAQAEAAAADAAEATDEPAVDFSDPAAVQKFIQDQVQAGLSQFSEQTKTEAQQVEILSQINSELDELGYVGEEMAKERKRVMEMAAERPDADIKAAHEEWEAEKEAIAKGFLEKMKAAPDALAPKNGAAPKTKTIDEETMTPAQRARRRLEDRAQRSPAA